MIKPEQIPDEVVDALWRDGYSFGDGLPSRQMWIMRDAIAAALQAWPGMMLKLDGRYALLPLPQEARDE